MSAWHFLLALGVLFVFGLLRAASNNAWANDVIANGEPPPAARVRRQVRRMRRERLKFNPALRGRP